MFRLSRSDVLGALLCCSLALVTQAKYIPADQCLTAYENGPYATDVPLYPRAVAHTGARSLARVLPMQNAEVTIMSRHSTGICPLSF